MMDWLTWENGTEWGKIYCPMLEEEVMTYYPKGGRCFDSYTAPFVDSNGEVCYYKYDHDEDGWYEECFYMDDYTEGMKCVL